jgi:hypothetical protein
MPNPKRKISLLALRALLEKAAEEPRTFTEHTLTSALKRQGDLASFSDPSLGIKGCALNTFKRACIELPGGYEAMDRLRLNALTRINEVRSADSSPPKTTKVALQSTVSLLKGGIAAADGDLLLLTKMLELSLRQARQYANDSHDKVIIERCRRQQAEIRDMMTLRTTSIPRLKLVRSENAEET